MKEEGRWAKDAWHDDEGGTTVEHDNGAKNLGGTTVEHGNGAKNSGDDNGGEHDRGGQICRRRRIQVRVKHEGENGWGGQSM